MSDLPISKAEMSVAMGLLLDVRAAPQDKAMRDRVEAWLAADSRHRRAWTHAQQAWNVLDKVEQASTATDIRPTQSAAVIAFPDPSRYRPPVRRRLLGALSGLAAAAAIALFLSPSLLLKLRADYSTRTAEIDNVRLADGTLVRLGARSAIDADVSGPVRKIRLVAGEAWFDVAHDARRPFIVESGLVETRVLGTAFEVRRIEESTEVGVGRGRVRVSVATPARPSADLLPGQRAIFDASGRLRRETLPVASIASWRDGHIFGNNVSVGAIVDQLRRYDSGWIIVTDGVIANKRVTGLYDARQPDKALDALIETAGGRITRITPYFTVIASQ